MVWTVQYEKFLFNFKPRNDQVLIESIKYTETAALHDVKIGIEFVGGMEFSPMI